MTQVKPTTSLAGDASNEEDGLPEEELQQMCHLHVQLFKTSLEDLEAPTAPAGHPLHTLMAENRALLDLLERWEGSLGRELDLEDLGDQLELIGQVELHYQRKENQLFPFLEHKDFTGPSLVMWGVHDEVRALLKSMRAGLVLGEPTLIRQRGLELSRGLRQMVHLEEKVLAGASLGLLDETEWLEMWRGEPEIGFAWIERGNEWPPPELHEQEDERHQGLLPLATGALSLEQVDLMLRHLPLRGPRCGRGVPRLHRGLPGRHRDPRPRGRATAAGVGGVDREGGRPRGRCARPRPPPGWALGVLARHVDLYDPELPCHPRRRGGLAAPSATDRVVSPDALRARELRASFTASDVGPRVAA